MSTYLFRDDDGYRAWLEANLAGHVLNIALNLSVNGARLRNAECWIVARPPVSGLTGAYVKELSTRPKCTCWREGCRQSDGTLQWFSKLIRIADPGELLCIAMCSIPASRDFGQFFGQERSFRRYSS